MKIERLIKNLEWLAHDLKAEPITVGERVLRTIYTAATIEGLTELQKEQGQ